MDKESIFGNLMNNHINGFMTDISLDPSNITVYPVSQFNLEGIKILIDNCKRIGDKNNNVAVATVDPIVWMCDLLDKHWDKISFVSTKPTFNILQVKSNKLVSTNYKTISINFDSMEELDEFFNKSQFKTFVLFSLVKYVNLSSMKSYCVLRYCDITEKYEERDKKINKILA